MIAALVLALALPAAPAAPMSVAPDPALTDDQVRSTAMAYLHAIDTPITVDDWRTLGPRALPVLEELLADPRTLPSRRAAAVGALAAVGGPRARRLVLARAHAEDEPFGVRVAALHGAALLLSPAELARELVPVLRDAKAPALRAAAADVLSARAPAACAVVRERAGADPQARPYLRRALERCGAP